MRDKRKLAKTSRMFGHGQDGEAHVPETEQADRGYIKFRIYYIVMNGEDGEKASVTMVMVNHEDGVIIRVVAVIALVILVVVLAITTIVIVIIIIILLVIVIVRVTVVAIGNSNRVMLVFVLIRIRRSHWASRRVEPVNSTSKLSPVNCAPIPFAPPWALPSGTLALVKR